MVYAREYLHVTCLQAGLETSGWKNKLFFVFVFFSWDFDGWKIHLCKLEL
jgi:hypothetical protein